MIGRISWFAEAIRVHSFALQALLRDHSISREAILASPVVKAFEDDPDWELIQFGGDWKPYKESPNPSQCECGNWWTSELREALYPALPNQNDIQTLMKTVPRPTDKKRPPCEGDCLSVRTRESDAWCIFKNNKTGQFGLTCTKTAMWHCEHVEP